MNPRYDLIVIGAGIVGLATARELMRRYPRLRLAVLEKETTVAAHQTGHNSGVIHSGIYYRPGSLKARMCVAGAAAMVSFCQEHGVPHEICGKVVIATDVSEIERLAELERRAVANGVPGVRRIGPEELRELEPHTRGVAALHVASTGTVDYRRVANKLAELITATGGEVLTGCGVVGFVNDGEEVRIATRAGELAARAVVNCAGLHSDRVARMAGADPGVRIVPFRGEYYEIAPGRRALVRNLIYPVPDPRFPFLGVHFTRRVNGEVEAGPNAVLALKREGYGKTAFSVRDLSETLRFPGFWRMASRMWRSGAAEYYRSFTKGAFTRALQRLLPAIEAGDLTAGGSGVRAQAVALDGRLVDDFHFAFSGNCVHVLNVPSPAATASLMIAEHVADMAEHRFGFLAKPSSRRS